MKNILHFAIVFTFTLFVSVGFFSSIAFADTFVVGDIDQDTTWTASDGPYAVFDMMSIDYGVTLSIEPGTIVKFYNNSGILVNGSIEVLGTVSDKVYFTSIYDDSLGGDTNMDDDLTSPASGDWRMILFNTGSVVGILNNLVINYSKDGIVVFDASIVSKNLNIDKELSLFNSKDSSFSNLSTSLVNLFDDSDVSIQGLSISNSQDYPLVGIYNGSSLSIDSAEISYGDDWGYVFGVYDFSHLSLSNSSILGINGDSTAISTSSNSNIDIDNLTASSVGNILNVNDGSYVSISNSNLSCNNIGFNTSNSSLSASSVSVDCSHYGVVSNGSKLSISDSIVGGASVDAINVCGYNFADTHITNTEIKNSGTGIHSFCEIFEAHGNSIHGNTIGAVNEASYMGDLQMDSNWWGSKTGPYHDTLNIYGLGDRALDGVSYYPWLPYDPLSAEMSNVLFIPGFQGSRLYRKKNIPIIGGIVDKLWEPNTNSDVTDLYMDNFGHSILSDIYTRDVIDKKSIFSLSGDIIYDSFITDMNDLVGSGKMSAWGTAPYDWRYDPMYVVEHGSLDAEGNIFYENDLLDADDPYIVKKIGELIQSSKSGRVTLVAHSNGGLVLKALMLKLEQMKIDGKNDYVDYIDKAIMVATPQMGTPKAVASILHGYDQELYYGVILRQSVARDFGIRLPGAYSLLPTSKYFYNVVDSPVLFDQSLNKINNFYKIFGEKISNYGDFVDFLLAKKKDRTTPAVSNLEAPAILFPGIFNDSVSIHEELDNYTFPSKTKVYQLAGWGLPTPKAVRYFTRNDCIPISPFSNKCKLEYNLDVEPVFTDDGDETVVTPSANYINNGNNYYLNLYKVNDFLKNSNPKNFLNHARIFDISYTREWIKNILKKSNVLPSYITKTKPVSKKNLVMYIHTTPGVDKDVSVSDKDGNSLGVKIDGSSDPDTTDFVSYTQNIPGGYYSRMGSNHYIHLDYSEDQNYEVSITPPSNTNNNSEQGSVIIRQDVVSGDTIESSVVVPSIPVSGGTTITTEIGAGGSVGSVDVDNESDGVVDSTVPSIPTQNPESPVQEDDNINYEIITSVDDSKSYGSTNTSSNNLSVPVAVNQSPVILNNDKNPIIIDHGVDIVTTGDTVVANTSIHHGELNLVIDNKFNIDDYVVASVSMSDIKIPWLKILNTILVSIIISVVLYKIMYKVK